MSNLRPDKIHHHQPGSAGTEASLDGSLVANDMVMTADVHPWSSPPAAGPSAASHDETQAVQEAPAGLGARLDSGRDAGSEIFRYTGTVQTFTVTESNSYQISCYGAQGGSGAGAGGVGGDGARIVGTFNLKAGEVLDIIVGGRGASSQSGQYYGGGGGGGSFVLEQLGGGQYRRLDIAGGGGGGGASTHGGGGVTFTSGANGYYSGGGQGGAGGTGGSPGLDGDGGGGGGYKGGAAGKSGYGSGHGYDGGASRYTAGGFGGGGGGAFDGGGGGGGFGGGGGGVGEISSGGGGGGSYNGGKYQLDIPAENTGDGFVSFGEMCYLRGTRILTPTGETQVEALQIGDPVVTRFGGIRQIRWIGRQSYAAAFVRGKRDSLPVCIRAGALGDRLPVRDLYVSPGHAMLIGDTLVLAKALVNGVNITQDWCPAEVHYYQPDLGTHDCVIAEGAWSETFADGPGLRDRFHNRAEHAALFPEHVAPDEVAMCAPRPARGPDLGQILLPVVARAAAALRPGPFQGQIERVRGRWKIQGWAFDLAHPELPVLVDVLTGDELLGSALACDDRPDPEAPGIGRGRCGFSFVAPFRLSRDMVAGLRIRRSADLAMGASPPPFRAAA